MLVLDLWKRLEYLSKQKMVLQEMVEANRKESREVLALLQEQGVTGLTTSHDHGCHEKHQHTEPSCCKKTCWCQRDISGPTEVGKKRN
jgi:hypothetical protein